jgi:hypothetical protein
VHILAPLRFTHRHIFLANHISDLLDLAFSFTCSGTHKQHPSNLASASLHPHVVVASSLAPTSLHRTISPITVPHRQLPDGQFSDFPTYPRRWCVYLIDGTVQIRAFTRWDMHHLVESLETRWDSAGVSPSFWGAEISFPTFCTSPILTSFL